MSGDTNQQRNGHDALTALAGALRSLHRELADRARRDVEQQRGSVIPPGEWLQQLVADRELGWLRALSELIVDLDVFLEADPAPADDDGAAVRAEVERLLDPAAAALADSFASRYWPYVHDEPRVGVAHGEVRQALERLPAPADVNEAQSLHERHGWTAARRHRGG